MSDTPQAVTHSTGGEPTLTVAELQPLVEQLLLKWIKKLGLDHWAITVSYGPCTNPDWSAECRREVAYDAAIITLAPDRHTSEEDVERSIVHELLHVKLAVFDLYRNVVTQNRPPGSAAEREEAALWTFCIEQAVKDLRRMVHGMTDFY